MFCRGLIVAWPNTLGGIPLAIVEGGFRQAVLLKTEDTVPIRPTCASAMRATEALSHLPAKPIGWAWEA